MPRHATLSLLPLLAALGAAPPPPAIDCHGDPLPPGAVARLGTTRGYHVGANRLSWSPDGKLIAALEQGGSVRAFDVPSFRVRWLAPEPDTAPDSFSNSTLAFSRDGKQVAVANFTSDLVRVLDADTGRELARVRTGNRPWSVSFGSDGTLAYAVYGKGVFLWDWHRKAEPRLLYSRKDVRQAAFSPDGKTVVSRTASEGGQLVVDCTVHDLTGKELSKHVLPAVEWHATLSPDGRFVVGPLKGGKSFLLIDPATGKTLHKVGADLDYYSYPSFSADGSSLTAGDEAGRARVWDTRTGKLSRSYDLGVGGLTNAALNANGTRLAVCVRADSRVHAYQLSVVKARPLLPELPGHGRGPVRAAFTPDGREVVTVQQGQQRYPIRDWEKWSVRRWDVATGKELAAFEHDLKGAVFETAVSPDTRLAVAMTDLGRFHVFDTGTGKQIADWMGPTRKIPPATERGRGGAGEARSVVFVTPTLIAAHAGKGLLLWDARTGKELPAIEGWERAPGLKLPEVTPYQPHVASGTGRDVWLVGGQTSKGARAVLVDPANPWSRRALPAQDWMPWLMTRSADGRMIVAVTRHEGEYGVRVIETDTGKDRMNIPAGKLWVNAVALCPRGRLLAFGGDRKAGVSVWDLDAGRLVRTFTGLGASFDRLVFSPDGTRLVSSGWENAPLVWDVTAYQTSNTPPAEDLDKAWAALVGEDAAAAWVGIRTLAASPKSVPFIRARLKGLTMPGVWRVKTLAAALEAGPRDAWQALEELDRHGHDAVPALRAAVAERPDLASAAQWLTRLKTARVADGTSALVARRACEALERLGTPEALALAAETARKWGER